MKLTESTIVRNFSMQTKTDNMYVPEELVERTFKGIVMSASKYLGMVKQKDKKVALSFEDAKGNFLLAAVVEYNKTDDAESQDNWNYYWTFYAEDIEDAIVYKTTQSQIQQVFLSTMYSAYKMKYNGSLIIAYLNTEFAKSISNFLDENAREGEVLDLELDGFFKASVCVENGEVVKSFLPDGAMKTIIKDDEATQVTAA